MKKRKSILDPHAARLEEWFAVENLTIADAQKRLWEDCNLRISAGRLSEWWQSRQSERLHESLLDRITTASGQAKEVEKRFAKDPPPELETLIKLHRTLIMGLTGQGTVDPKLLKTVTMLMITVMESEKLKHKEKQLGLDIDKFKFDAVKACQKHLAEIQGIQADTSLDDDAKVDRIRMRLFGSTPK